MLRRSHLRDVYEEDGRSAVLVSDQVVVLSELATTILLAVPEDGEAGLDTVVTALVEEYGEPPAPHSAEDLARDQVETLLAHGVLARSDAVHAAALTTPAADAVRAALRHALARAAADGASDAPEPWTLPDGVTPAEFVAAAQRHRVSSALALVGDTLDLPVEARAGLEARHRNETATVHVLAGELTEALSALDRAGVRAMAFKGIALAVQAHGDESARGTGDHDLLVAPADVEAALGVLQGLGWKIMSAFPTPGPSWAWRHLVRTAYEIPLVRDGHMVDLHWHLVASRDSYGDFDALWARRETVTVLGHPVATLNRYDALRHSAAHATTDDRRYLRGLYDVAVLLRDPRTWASADRPFSHGERVTVGVAAQMLDLGPGLPAVVGHARAEADEATAAARTAQGVHVPPTTSRIPGASLLSGASIGLRAHRSPADLRRQLSSAVFLAKFTSQERSPHAYVAAPRVLARRAADAWGRARKALPARTPRLRRG
ncbi:MAG: nucleotidyltransferase family protein [Nocardioides sp.]|uniref:nucleotidyltransferase family protein n=1 Tax=Nocardioides sp. TaxID=35761 RepID=UPI003F0BB727